MLIITRDGGCWCWCLGRCFRFWSRRPYWAPCKFSGSQINRRCFRWTAGWTRTTVTGILAIFPSIFPWNAQSTDPTRPHGEPLATLNYVKIHKNLSLSVVNAPIITKAARSFTNIHGRVRCFANGRSIACPVLCAQPDAIFRDVNPFNIKCYTKEIGTSAVDGWFCRY